MSNGFMNSLRVSRCYHIDREGEDTNRGTLKDPHLWSFLMGAAVRSVH